MVIKDFGIKLYPNILAEADLLTHFRSPAYYTEFKDKKRQFREEYNIEWEDLVKEVLNYIDEQAKNDIRISLEKDDILDADVLYQYLRRNGFDDVDGKLIKKIKSDKKEFSRFF